MARKFKTVDHEQSGRQTLTIDDCLPADHLAGFIVAIVLQQEVDELLALGEQADQTELPQGLDIETEVAFRQDRLLNLAEAKRVLKARAEERYQFELAEYQAKLQARTEKAQEAGHKLRGPEPTPPVQTGPRDKDQYNFTDPESRIMKNSANDGFDQHYNVQVAVDQGSLLVVGNTLSNHPVDTYEAIPTVDAIPPEIGKPAAAALDKIYFAPQNIQDFKAREIEPFIATGREPHHKSWQERFVQTPEPPPDEASPMVKMAYKLQTEIGKAIYGLRKSTVEPVIGIIKEVLGFRQFSLRGLGAAAGEWCPVCDEQFERLVEFVRHAYMDATQAGPITGTPQEAQDAPTG
jgi:hypothetical protein